MKNFLLGISLFFATTFLLLLNDSLASQWKYKESKDVLTGEVTSRYVVTWSVLPVETSWGTETQMALGLQCGDKAPYFRSAVTKCSTGTSNIVRIGRFLLMKLKILKTSSMSSALPSTGCNRLMNFGRHKPVLGYHIPTKNSLLRPSLRATI